MTHPEMNELYELYCLGVLDFESAAEIDKHVADGCTYCLQHIREAVNLTATFASLAEQTAPPAALKKRIIGSIRPATASTRVPWLTAVSLLGAACAALLLFTFWSTTRTRETEQLLHTVTGERNQLRSALEILTRSQTRTIQFGQNGNQAHGWLFVNQQTGFVFVGSDLPRIAADRTFELWLVPAKGAPAPVGLMRPDQSGQFVQVSQTPINRAQIAAFAVSVEPLGGSTAPTTTPFLIVPLS